MNQRSKEVRRKTLELMVRYGGTHWGGSFSVIEILLAIEKVFQPLSDYLILSKGHACWPYYVLLNEKGYATKYEAHPHRAPTSRITATTGSLGHGLPYAIGIAMGMKIRESPGIVYCVVGDGECQEGSMYESICIAEHLMLRNLCIIEDNNRIQGSGACVVTGEHSLIKIVQKRNFYFSDVDGHDVEKIVQALEAGTELVQSPKYIRAATTKGKGVSFMENDPAWHSKPLLGTELKNARWELSDEN